MELYLTEIQVTDWPAVVRWYQDTLGLRMVLEDASGRYALFETAAGRLALKEHSGGGLSPAPSCRLVFRVDDLEAIAHDLHAKGVPVGEPSEHATEAFRFVRLNDPSGTTITLFAWRDDRETKTPL